MNTAQLPAPLRAFLLQGALRFAAAVGGMPGVDRIALVGSLTTNKASPKDADVLVTVTSDYLPCTALWPKGVSQR